MKKFLKVLLVLFALLIAALSFIRWKIDYEKASVTPLSMSTQDVDLSVTLDPDFVPKRLLPTGEPQNPFMAITDSSVMHSGGWESDTHPAAGVFSANPQRLSRRVGGSAARQCATFTFTSKGQPLMLCGGFTSFQLQLLDPETLERLTKFDLPMRPSGIEALVKKDPEIIFSDTSSAYIYLDDKDRVVIGDSQQRIRRIGPVEENGKWTFKIFDSWDLAPYLPRDCFTLMHQNPEGECDALTTVMPDFGGRLWWVTRNGRVGSLDPDSGSVQMTKLEGEEIQNSFAIDASGAYIVSDHAMYGMQLDVAGVPQIKWRLPYDRGSGRKVGSINQGSGTSPTILGGGKYVTFTDNADDKIAIIAAYTGQVPEGKTRQICRVPVFKSGASATDNSMVGYDRSIILENNHGFTNAIQHKDYSSVTGGVVRVDIREDESGCDIIWESDLKVPSVVPKMSLGNGIAYFYSFDLLENGDRLWALIGLDYETGKEVARIPTGTGVAYNNNWASIAIAPNGDTYVGTREGLLRLRD